MSRKKDNRNTWRYSAVVRKDFRDGAVEEDDFVDEFRYVRLNRKVSRKFCGKNLTEVCKDFIWITRWSSRPNEVGMYREYGDWKCTECHRHRMSWGSRIRYIK